MSHQDRALEEHYLTFMAGSLGQEAAADLRGILGKMRRDDGLTFGVRVAFLLQAEAAARGWA